MRFTTALTRLLHVGLMLALMLGVVLRPSLSELAELHAEEHRSLAAHVTHGGADITSHDAHHDRGIDAAGSGSQGHGDGHGLHALMHLSWTGGSVGHLVSGLLTPSVKLSAAHPWRPLPAVASAVRLPNPLRPPIA